MAPDDIRDLFAAFGHVHVRRMFGGSGIFADGLMFALVHDGVIYLKVDGHNAPAFEREGLSPFTYRRRSESASLSYRRMPDRLYDDPDELAAWARQGFAAARRGQAQKRAPARKRTGPKRSGRK